MVQERIDLRKELQSKGDGADVSAMEAAFVDVAKSYSERQGSSDTAWRQLGVQPAVLKQAGISRLS